MIPRAPPSAVVNSPYQAAAHNKNSMLDKLKLFKNNDRPVSTVTGKRTSSSSGVSSARSERSDSSASLEPNIDLKPVRNNARIKQQKTTKIVPTKNSPSANKKEIINGIAPKPSKVAADVEKHANKIANLPTSKLAELKVKVSSVKPDVGSNKIASQGPQGGLPTQQVPGTGIPKPTALVKGTSKPPREDKTPSATKQPSTISREGSQGSIATTKVALVSPIKSGDNQLSESSHSASTGQHSNSSESSVIYKPSSDSSSEHNNVIPNRKEQPTYFTDVSETPTTTSSSPRESPKKHQDETAKILNSHTRESSQGDDDSGSINVEPMRPLLRGYCSTLTLPSRQRHYPRLQPDGIADFCEISTGNGYLSDGEMLRNQPNRELCDGYVSEGGAVLYARRMQAGSGHVPNG